LSVAGVDPRILQANERTLLAWFRVGLALMAFGFALAGLATWLRYEHDLSGHFAVYVIGAAAIVMGAICQVLGVVRFSAVRRALLENRTPVPGAGAPIALAIMVTLLGLSLLVYVLLI
jgi:uncharacterized membrane protein YidH (DUF202 family)